MTLYVKGIPKSTCTSRDIVKIFSSVAQVKCVKIDQEHGRARVELHDKASTSFVLTKKWRINGSELHVADSEQSIAKGSNSITYNEIEMRSARNISTRTKSEKPYQLYKRNANSFWADIPHDASRIRAKKDKVKFYIGFKKRTCAENMIGMCQNKRKTQKRNSKKSIVKQHLFSHSYNSLNLDEFISYVDKIIKEISSSNYADIQKGTIPGPKCSGDENKYTLNRTQPPRVNSPKQKTDHYQDIPVCVLFKGNINVLWYNPYFTSLLELNDKIKTEMGIPTKLQLLLYNGKVLNPKCLTSFKPYENIHLLIKGKGGMQRTNKGISKDSSEKDIEEWLKTEVGLKDDLFTDYPILTDLNGTLLFDYAENSANTFSSDASIPKGLARKILAFRDERFEGIDNDLLKKTPEEIAKYVRIALGTNNARIERLCEFIVERHIDGFVFYSYTDEEQFKSDFVDLDIQLLYFKKVILKRNMDFKIESQITSFITEEMPTTAHHISSKTNREDNAEFLPDSIQHAMQKSHSIQSKGDRYKEILGSLLLLYDKEESKCEPCQFKILYGAWTNINELEKRFVFYLVCREDEYTESKVRTGLWKLIKKHTQQWLDLLPEKTKNLFTKSKQCGIYTFNGKKMELSNQCKLAFVMEKKCEDIQNFDVPIILISKNIFRNRRNCFVASLSNCIVPERFYFSFKPSKTFVFDPDDYSKGFKLHFTDPSPEVNTRTNTSDVTENNNIQDNNTDKKVSEMGICESTDKCSSQAQEKTKSCDVNEINEYKYDIQIPRDFEEKPDDVIYHFGSIFSQPENDGTLSLRCLEFKSFFSCVNKAKETRFAKFQKETLKFACGCLNARKNGTIYFGVADSVEQIDGETYKHGEIVGFQISENNSDSRSKYTDVLRCGISDCFDENTKDIALKCISDPRFVRVVISGEKFFRFVMEVDIKPSLSLCKGLHFEANLNEIENLKDRSVKKKFVIYVRKGSSTIQHAEHNDKKLFINVDLPRFDIERKIFEERRKPRCVSHKEVLATKLERLLTRGTFKFDEGFWPILLLGKPNDKQKENEQFGGSLSFIKRIQFTAVFDFDDFSNINGLCWLHRNPERSTISTEQMFHDNAGNLQDLAKKLGILHHSKTVWIFANGQNDSLEPKPHLKRVDWHSHYSAGISDAVSFFNQDFVIPKNRELILVLLFSNDFHGVIDTFNEITRNFGWDSIVIIAEENRLFDEFVDTIEREGKGSKENLKEVSVIGMPWHHVNRKIISLLGYNEKLDCVLPCSSGVQMNVEEKFVNKLAYLNILSATQCENKEFPTSDIRKQFARKHEMDFYKGQRVNWWNFFFENHVCSRLIYDKIQKKAFDYLSHPEEETRKVVTLIIAHEPGAGATTIGYQLLWHFRKENRCCVILKLSETTIMHIASLLIYNEDKQSNLRPKPLVLFLDDIVQTELSVSNFITKLNMEFRKEYLNYIDGMTCLLIICQREEKLRGNEYRRENIFYLEQQFIKSEKKWFTNKFVELERIGEELDIEDYKPQNLLSFMILRSGFNKEYIKSTIQYLVSNIDQTSNEYKLIKYVSFLATYTPYPMRGMKVFVPLGCCDKLMGMTPPWESRLSSALKTLLIIEKNELDSGKKVRIAHPSLGKEILGEIMNREKLELFDIAKEYLSCSLLQSSSLGIKRLEEFTRDMLIRRKKEEYNSVKATKFSPLIQDIIENPKKNYGKAAEILKLGFDKFRDAILAQVLARLYSEWQNFEEAIKWAIIAEELSSEQSLSFIRHTHGLVLRDNFKHLTAKTIFNPKDVHEYLQLSLRSLDVFFRAKNEQDDETDTQILLNLLEAIIDINQITTFLTDNVSYVTDKEDIIRYLKDPYFVPEEINAIWGSFHERLKGMRKKAEDAFKILENNVCFYSIFSEEVLQTTSQPKKEDLFYRRFHNGYKYMHENFSRIYGENDYTVSGIDQAEIDSYHRGRLWTLKGNSYLNIFNHIRNSENSKATKDVLCEIREHLAQIKYRNTNDLANQVCVNVALGIVGYSNQDSESNILGTCQLIIQRKDENEDLAHFFMSMLLWTNNTMPLQKKYSQLDESLSHLKTKFKKRKYKQTEKKNEGKFSQPRAQFFLGKGWGITSLCHTSQIPMFGRKGANSQFDNSLWEDNTTKDRLRRLYGTIEISKDSRRTIVYCMWDNKESIKISKIRGLTTKFLSKEKVSFYLGFSIAGPIAYYIKSARDESVHQKMPTHHELTSRVEYYLEKNEEELENYIETIIRSEGKSQDRLKEREKQLMKDKDDIVEALEQLKIKNGNADFSDLFE